MSWNNSFFGFDFNGDGKIDSKDDAMFMMYMDDVEKKAMGLDEDEDDDESDFDSE